MTIEPFIVPYSEAAWMICATAWRGGCFAAAEEPELLAQDIYAFFHGLRK